ncbi:hypothetical protein LXL04_012959 [Taraxacum kok-saghyz]
MPYGKLMRSDSDASSSNSHSPALKRGSERRTNSATMYVPRNNSGNGSRSGKEKSTYVQVNKRDDQQHHPVSTIEKLGLCISVYDIESIDGGFIFANEGAPTYKVCLQLLFNISLKKLYNC